MRVYTCPKCYKVNPSTHFICKRCETSLLKLPEMKLTRSEAKVLQESLYRSHGHEVIEQLKAEYGASEQYYLAGEDLDLTKKLPFKVNVLWQQCVALITEMPKAILIIVPFVFIALYMKNLDSLMDSFVQYMITLIFLIGFLMISSIQMGIFLKNVKVTKDYVKIGQTKIPWHQIHRIGFCKSQVSVKNRVILEIWYGQSPESIKLSMQRTQKIGTLRHILEAISKEKTIAFYVDQEGWK